MNYHNILNLCQYCAKVYVTESIIEHSTDTEVLIDKQPDKIIIAFCGSESIVDWKQNIDFILRPFPQNRKCKVHSGFLECFLSVKNKINKILELIQNEKLPVFFTGHSLGGAIATLAAVDAKMSYQNLNITCVTFGSPKPGDKNFSLLYSSLGISTYRVVNSNDIVPSLPKWWQGNYYHVCPAYQIGFTNIFSAIKLTNKIKNHYVSKYIEVLEKQLSINHFDFTR